jgi:hypothetical protein
MFQEIMTRRDFLVQDKLAEDFNEKDIAKQINFDKGPDYQL